MAIPLQAPFSLAGKRVLLTQAGEFMGPALAAQLRALGAEVVCSERPLAEPQAAQEVVQAAGEVHVLVMHLAYPAPSTRVEDVQEDEWRDLFAHLVDPMPRLARAVLPQMLQRGHGKILVMGSAAALRGQKRTSAYSAARGAQLAWVQSAGLELAPRNIQVNAIAQNLVDNPTYFPPEVQANPKFQERLQREVPLGRLVSAQEDAAFAAYLCSDAADCFVGQVFPLSGGWAIR
ncbi:MULTISPECIES: SDR family oxidoreductase [Ramlibacter]|uniref:SDR family oxidoreductase n=1 Tax=Ramlibacter aquaticus TaxID=2780094 RepID=A0ABR9SAV3_9BURK|nr:MULTISPECIES: SDR family oxidoreductase [Ramlibacter]MBE7939473.1 SDR family oxidoreductase [Ramlibacter aquaticus]